MAVKINRRVSHFGLVKLTSCRKSEIKEAFHQGHTTPRAAIVGCRYVPGRSFKENLGHHPLVLVIQEVAMKDGHPPDYRIGEIHDHVHRPTVWDIHGV